MPALISRFLDFVMIMEADKYTASDSDTPDSSSESELTSESEDSAGLESVSLTGKSATNKGSRKAYRTQKDLNDSFEKSDIPGVCDAYAPALKQIKETFKVLKHQGTELKKRKNRLPHPKKPDWEQNKWLCANIFDTMGKLSLLSQVHCESLAY